MMGSSTTLVGRSILVVEDEAVIAFGLKELFEAEGANVHIASTPNDALSLADDLVISAAVIDFGSRGDDNGGLCRTLRAYGIPFMYYTGYDDIDEGRSGAPVVTKPASAQTLIATIAQLLAAPSDVHSSGMTPDPQDAHLRRSKANSHSPHR
jgi:CheY-like chemotaxis protein